MPFGVDDLYESGYESGYKDAYNKGYNKGFKDGKECTLVSIDAVEDITDRMIRIISEMDWEKLLKTGTPYEERSKGEWINPSENPEFSNKDFFNDCSLCGHTQMDKSNFCPNCGADMRKEAENEKMYRTPMD